MRHPLACIPAGPRRRVFLALLGVTLALAVAMGRIDEQLRTPAAPLGIMSFELARDADTAAAIVASWDASARAWAAFQTGLDYLFLLAYSTTIAFGALWAGAVLGVPRLGSALAWGQWAAAALDAVENAALMQILLAGGGAPWPALAFWCAAPKFALAGAGLLLALAGGLAWSAGRRAPVLP